MHIQIPCPYENNVTNTTTKSLPLRFSSPLPFLLFAQPWPPFFLSETETKLYWVQSETKTIYSPFHNLENSIWKNSLRFVSALILLMWSLCLPSANWHLCVVHRAATDRTTTSSRAGFAWIFFTFNFFGKSIQQAPLVLLITFVPQIYIQSSDWFD